MPAINTRGIKPEREGTDSLVTWLAQDCKLLQCSAFVYPGPITKGPTGTVLYTIGQWRFPLAGQQWQLLGYEVIMGSPDTGGNGYDAPGVAPFVDISAWIPINAGTLGAFSAVKPSCAVVIGRNMRNAIPGKWHTEAAPTGGIASYIRQQTESPADRIVIPPPVGVATDYFTNFTQERVVNALSPAAFPLVANDTLSVCVAFGDNANVPSGGEAWAWPVQVQLRLGATVNLGNYQS